MVYTSIRNGLQASIKQKIMLFSGLSDQDFNGLKVFCNVTKTSIRRWKAGQPIKKRYWKPIANYLKKDVKEVENYNAELLRKQGRIKVCRICGKEFQSRFQRTIVCSSKCRIKLKPKSDYKLKMDVHYKSIFIDSLSKQETRDLIRSETINYLNKGSKIEKLKPEEAYFTFDSIGYEPL